jgi:hypothetical protein
MTTRVRCPVCAQWPTTRKDGTLAIHLYPWHHKQKGKPCPGSGRPTPNQLSLEEHATP